MTRLLFAAVTAFALSGTAASAQTVYVTPGYGAQAYIVPGYNYTVPAPAYVIPAPTAVVPAWDYYATTPLYGYAPGYGTYVVGTPAWGW